MVEGGQKLSLRMIFGSEGARHPRTLQFCCNFVEQPLFRVFLWKKQWGPRLNGVTPCMVAIYVVCLLFLYMFCNLLWINDKRKEGRSVTQCVAIRFRLCWHHLDDLFVRFNAKPTQRTEYEISQETGSWGGKEGPRVDREGKKRPVGLS